MISRRRFLQAGAGTAAFLALRNKAFGFYQSPGLQLWKTNLRGAGPSAIPVAFPDPTAAPVTGVTHYTIDIGQFSDFLHPSLDSTLLWGFDPTRQFPDASAPRPKHLGGIIVAQKGSPIQITFRNNLPTQSQPWGQIHIMPVDTTIPGAGQAQNRAAVHLHGGFVPWISDGGPFDTFTPDGVHGISFLNNSVLNPGAAINEAEYFYPNDQSARLVWYHDHSQGVTRLNAYSGIASAYIIRDLFESNLINRGLPDYLEHGGNELPIILQDKIFVDPGTIGIFDPTWQGPRTKGALWYAHTYEPDRWDLEKGFPPPADPSVVAEFFGDTMLANGTVYPEVSVEPRRYRLRILNACNARFANLQLYVDDGSPDGITLDRKGNPLNAVFLNPAANPAGRPKSDFLVIGTEGGFLPKPALVLASTPFDRTALAGSLILGPAERADVLVDFSVHAGQNLILYTDAPAPYPDGDARNDYFPLWDVKGNPVNGTTLPGFGPNTRVIMRFKVGTMITPPLDRPLTIATATDLRAGNDRLLVPSGVTTLPAGIPVRQLTLNESFDAYGRLIQLLGTNRRQLDGEFGLRYEDPVTESPRQNTIEVWQIANLTGDTHPIHFHLVNVQIISRQRITKRYDGTPHPIAHPRPPAPEESGWKETVRMNPGELTTIIMQFRLPANPPNVASIPESPRTGGNEYVWHCHILEHEEHDMMRPLVVR
jgi:spore coat protein A